MLKKIKNFFLNKEIRFNYLTEMGFFNHLSDEEFLKKKYKLLMGKELNLNPPVTFNEKLQWLKIHDHNPLYTTMVDKYAAKDYVANIIGKEHIIPTLGVWDHFDEIDFEQLPNEFVLKCTHDSGGLVICHDKNKLDRKAAKRKIEKCLKRNYYWSGREWPYKDVKPRIIAEKYMTDGENMGIMDYKMMCFNGKQKASFVCTNRFSKDGLKITFYNTDWKRMPFERHYPASKVEIEKPKTYDEMVELVEKLATNIPFVRVDFYEVFGKIYFGELTFSPGSDFEEFSPSEWDNNIGDWLELPEDGGVLIYNKGYVVWVHKIDDDLKNDELKDYKFYCFNGKVKLCGIYSDRNSEEKTKADYYDRDFNWIDMTWGYENTKKKLHRPQFWDEMIEIAEKLSENISHVRVDLYRSKNSVYFGELTFYDGSGFDEINPLEWDKKLGEHITLKNVGETVRKLG